MTRAFAQVVPQVYDFTPYSPGLTIEEIQERYGLPQVVKLASNENPLGASPAVVKALQKAASQTFRYPQPGALKLGEAIAAYHGVPADTVVPGNGSDEIIDLLMRLRAVPGKHNIVTCKPCFSMYTVQARLAAVELRQVPLNRDFTPDWGALLDAVDENTALVFITTPDNPSGYLTPREEIAAFAKKLPPYALLVVDEAYMDFADDEQAASILFMPDRPENTAVLRTFSKCFGLAGLRVGYGIMPSELADYMRRVHMPFSVNILAEEGGIAALGDMAFREETLCAVREGREYLTRELKELGCTVFPSQSNFLMFGLPPYKGHSARNVFEALLTRGIILRPLGSYDLPDYLRVTIGNAMENKIFISALSKLLPQTE